MGIKRSADNVGVVTLDASETAIEGVVVSAELPVVRVEEGRLDYDLEAATRGMTVNNAYEAITRLPGVSEQEGRLTLAGAGSVTVILNGKPTTMSTDQLEALLRSTPVERVERAVANQEKIMVYGDYDVDGITATVILVDYLKSRGVDVLHYIPRRIEDGYGLGQDAIRSLHEQGVELLITVDCGITGVEEVDFAASLGMDVVITDHHECKDTLPRAVAVVDPHRPDCTYPFPYLAGCGVALKLVLALGGESREEALFSRYCTLAAIGTIADVMPMSGENRIIVSRGLECITQSDFIGLHALLQEAGLMDKAITSVQVGFVLAPRINAAGRMGAADKAADLLLCQDPAEAARLARELCALNRERQAVEQTIYAQAVEQIDHLPPQERSALVLASDTWHQGVVGIVASRMAEGITRRPLESMLLLDFPNSLAMQESPLPPDFWVRMGSW